MDRAHAVPLIVPRPLVRRMAHRGVTASDLRQAVVPLLLIGVDRRHRPTRPPHHLLQGLAIRGRDDRQADLAARASDHPTDRREFLCIGTTRVDALGWSSMILPQSMEVLWE